MLVGHMDGKSHMVAITVYISDVFLLLQCEHGLEKYSLQRRFFHYCCHVLDDCKTEQDVKNKFVALDTWC